MRKVLFSLFISASLLCTTAFASVGDDQVTSQKIKEADGTSAQNTNSGSGVKTGHIQDGAVTNPKIVNGAVTDAKISGVISVTKLPVGTTAGSVASGDHNHDSLYQRKYANVVVVAKSGGDFTDPIAAVNSITNASVINPYLVKIMPGIYDLGSNSLLMMEYVDVEGSGQQNTVLLSSAPVIGFTGVNNTSLSNMGIQGLISMWYPGEGIVLRDLSISDGIGSQCVGCSLTLENITSKGTVQFLTTFGPSYYVKMNNVKVAISATYPADAWGLYAGGGNFEISNSSFEASNGNYSVGIYAGGSTMKILNSVLVANGGNTTFALWNYTAPLLELRNCEVRANSAQGNVASIIGNYLDTFVANSLIEGPFSGNPKTFNCFTSNYDPFP